MQLFRPPTVAFTLHLALLTRLSLWSTAAPAVSKTTKVTLVTFDVDGTLVKGSGKQASYSSHARAFGHAVGRVYRNIQDWEQTYPSPLLLIPPERYHGCTDGLIALNMASYGFGMSPAEASPKLAMVFKTMAEYFSAIPDEDVMFGIEPLPGVISTLERIAALRMKNVNVVVGLVTGNVEGIARKKMRACSILQTKCLSPAAPDQDWDGENAAAFLGGFGSDFCSNDIEDMSRIYKDRGEQIAIAYRRALSMLAPGQEIARVVHVGDAPADILAARYVATEAGAMLGSGNVEVGCIGVATGKFTAAELSELAGEAIPGRWDPVVLERGLADDAFIERLKIVGYESDTALV